MRTLPLFVFLVASLFAHASFAQHRSTTNKQDEKLIKLIASLPEVHQSDQYIRKQTHGKRHLITNIDQRPTKKDNCYRLAVSEFNGTNLVPHFKFFVDARTYTISYWDVLNDKAIPLQQWRKHHYKY